MFLLTVWLSFFRSIHNIRIERLWVDVTAQFGAKWHQFFVSLELHHGLNINNLNHRWLLQHLYLPNINADAAFFAEAWNRHKIKTRGQPSRSPADLWGFDMIVHGVRGADVAVGQDSLDEPELMEFGVDWEALDDADVIAANLGNNGRSEGTSSWVGRVGPPPNLNEVPVYAPGVPLTAADISRMDSFLLRFGDSYDPALQTARWSQALAFACTCNTDF